MCYRSRVFSVSHSLSFSLLLLLSLRSFSLLAVHFCTRHSHMPLTFIHNIGLQHISSTVCACSLVKAAINTSTAKNEHDEDVPKINFTSGELEQASGDSMSNSIYTAKFVHTAQAPNPIRKPYFLFSSSHTKNKNEAEHMNLVKLS
jgi:hypothetical protein